MTIRGQFQTVRDNILVLNQCTKFENGVGHRARKELDNEITLLSLLRQRYFGSLRQIDIAPRVIEEALEWAEVYDAPTLEEKRRWLAMASVPFHDEYFTPCRVMWIKVIIRAAYDYALWKTSPDLRQRKYAQDAEKWLFGESTLLNSFKSICFLCRLPMKDLLDWATNLTRDQVKKFEFLERSGKDPMALTLQKRAGDGFDS